MNPRLPPNFLWVAAGKQTQNQPETVGREICPPEGPGSDLLLVTVCFNICLNSPGQNSKKLVRFTPVQMRSCKKPFPGFIVRKAPSTIILHLQRASAKRSQSRTRPVLSPRIRDGEHADQFESRSRPFHVHSVFRFHFYTSSHTYYRWG